MSLFPRRPFKASSVRHNCSCSKAEYASTRCGKRPENSSAAPTPTRGTKSPRSQKFAMLRPASRTQARLTSAMRSRSFCFVGSTKRSSRFLSLSRSICRALSPDPGPPSSCNTSMSKASFWTAELVKTPKMRDLPVPASSPLEWMCCMYRMFQKCRPSARSFSRRLSMKLLLLESLLLQKSRRRRNSFLFTAMLVLCEFGCRKRQLRPKAQPRL
mmetsp:Transcript_73785/g.213500  ORF Transcript_73785/g.213500 Transcript_73785/m.213500 type:complete len:214 (-) Transcript_73785:1046-1687(-)